MIKRKTEDDVKKERAIERKREFMCAHYPLCRGCPIDKASKADKLSCGLYRIRRPDEVARIVLEWEFEHCPSARPAIE